jgi:branched-chain amino acid transport system ATP-binding protein
VSYGAIHALKGITFDLQEGEIVALIGANGAGKSTTLNTISGIMRPDIGSVVFEEEEISEISPAQIVEKGIVQVPEGRKIFARMSVLENLEMGAYTIKDNRPPPGGAPTPDGRDAFRR